MSWLFIGAYYCYPNAEDLSLTAYPRDLGIVKSITSLLISYDGRYLTNLLHGINPLVFNSIQGYKFMPVIAILFFAGTLGFLLHTLFRFDRVVKLVLFTLLFTVIHFATAPSLPHDLYWMVSCFVYLYPWGFIFLWTGAYLRYIHAGPDGFRWFVATAIFLICSIGLNEMFLVTNLSLLALISYYAYIADRSIRQKTIPIVVIGIACILFFISCPGIEMRAADNRLPGESFFYQKGVVQSIFDYKKAGFDLLVSGILLFASLLITFNIGTVKLRYQILESFTEGRRLKWLTAIFLIIAYLMTLAYYLPMQVDTGYPSRIFNSSVVLQQMAFFVLIPLLLFRRKTIQKISTSTAFRQIFSLVLLTLLCVAILISNNNISQMALEFRSGVFKNYKKTMDHRYACINEAKRRTACWQVAVVDSLKDPPSTIYYGPEIRSNRDASHWNVAYEIYFGIDEIKIQGDTTQKLSF